MTREEKLTSLYKSCLENNYIDMSDENHQLKAKVYAMDLKLKYKNIADLYNEAKELYEQEEAKKKAKEKTEAVDGDKIFTLTDEHNKKYSIYQRPDGSIYCKLSRNPNKINDISFGFRKSGGVLNYTYHPSKTVYTGASSGGISMGGFHQTKSYYTETGKYNGKGAVIFEFGNRSVALARITVTPEIGKLFKRDEVFKRRFSKNSALCMNIDENTYNTGMRMALSSSSDANMVMSRVSRVLDDKYIQLSVCAEFAEFLKRVVSKDYPEQDEDIYTKAKKLAESNVKSHLFTAKDLFTEIKTYKDSAEQINIVLQKIDDVREKEQEQNQLRKEQEQLKKEQKLLRKEARSKTAKLLGVVSLVIITIVLVFVIILTTIIIPNDKYNNAIALVESGNIVEAYDAFIALDEYKDSNEQAEAIYGMYKLEKIKRSQIGDYVKFGSYEQDGNISNGTEEIEWFVLEKQGNRVLVISKYGLDCKQFNETKRDVTWETCTLRKWLNDDFINSSFSDEEKSLVPTVTVSADGNSGYDTNPGKATQDKVFLLSIDEAKKYFSSKDDRMCVATAFAYKLASKNDSVRTDIECPYWLRTPGPTQDSTAFISMDGGIIGNNEFVLFVGDTQINGVDVDADDVVIRPAMWIEIE